MSEFSELLRGSFPDGWSNRDVAREADRLGISLSRATVDKYTRDGHGTPTEDTIKAFHEVLGVPLIRLREAAGVSVGEAGPWRPPLEADQLNKRQRAAMDELIRVLVFQHRELDHQRDQHLRATEEALSSLAGRVIESLRKLATLFEWTVDQVPEKIRETFEERAETATQPLIAAAVEYRDNVGKMVASRRAAETALGGIDEVLNNLTFSSSHSPDDVEALFSWGRGVRPSTTSEETGVSRNQQSGQ